MTSFLKPTTLKRWFASNWIPIAAFLILFLASGFVGLSDDESYDWVLAQTPALGYAFHPPMVAWMIFLSQKIFGGLFGPSSAAVVRFFSCLGIGVLFAFSLDWMARTGATKRKGLSALALASFAGLFGLGWMMVPDVPLFLGWILAFHSAWRIGFEKKESASSYVLLGLGVCIAILGKYSGVLVPFSAVISILMGPFGKKRLLKAFVVATTGTIVALIPILIWNSQHEWQSILYQIHERHQDAEISFKRYFRFWLIELVAAGPFLVFYSLRVLKRALDRENKTFQFIALWMLPPALVFLIQPLFSDFKPHWAFVVWLPGALALAWEARTRKIRFLKIQIGYGLTLIAIVLLSMQFPLMSLVIHHFKGKDYDPRWDVTNDLYGWTRFAEFVRAHPAPQGKTPYVTASRYQTASQAAAALGSLDSVTLLPRDLKARDEWRPLPISLGIGPAWPELTQPVLYVGDNRYDAPPQFPSSRCEQIAILDTSRLGLLAKRILVWKCQPISWQD